MIPQFTAEAGLVRSRAGYAPGRLRLPLQGGFVPQQRVVLDPRGGGDDSLHWGGAGTTVTCPGCAQHACGFLGLSTCLTCC